MKLLLRTVRGKEKEQNKKDRERWGKALKKLEKEPEIVPPSAPKPASDPSNGPKLDATNTSANVLNGSPPGWPVVPGRTDGASADNAEDSEMSAGGGGLKQRWLGLVLGAAVTAVAVSVSAAFLMRRRR